MTCVHKVRWSVKRPEDCRFRLSVSHYKDRIVAPDEYSGATEVTPSDEIQTLPTTGKLVRSDITVNPAPVEPLSTTENGSFTPSEGNVGFSSVTVDVEPALESLSVTENGLYLPESDVDGFDRVSVDVPVPSGSTTITENGTHNVEQYASAVVDVPTTGYDKGTLIYEGTFSSTTSQWNVTSLPNNVPFAFDKIVVNVSNLGTGINTNWRQYFRSDLPMTGNTEYVLNSGTAGFISGATALVTSTEIVIDDDGCVSLLTVAHDTQEPTLSKASIVRRLHGVYDKITAYGWWMWSCPAGAHIKITGYNRTT